ncbi:lipoate--protein ligase family protein [Cohnella lubricantis]|nr:lipoate--protein ligase family protein [Cohnella lubricantis]
MLILDRSQLLEEPDALYPFALDEWLGRCAGEGGPAVCHLWRHPSALILGSRDSRLPGAAAAAQQLEADGYDVVVRHSGGAAVPLDTGVLNVSLILPKTSSSLSDFREDFEKMYTLIREALAGTGRRVDKGEIAGAYCPGDYDLSIDGLKFCGIAQRRQARATIVQAFIVAEGSGQARARLVRAFYEEAASGIAKPEDYPLVTEDSTASLGELLGLGHGAAAVLTEEIKRVIGSLQSEEGLAAAGAAARLPDPNEIRANARTMRLKYWISNT